MNQESVQNLDETEGNPLQQARDAQLNRKRISSVLKSIPGTSKHLSEACKVFQPIKKSIFLDRKQKVPSEEDIYVCDCVKSSKATPEELSDPCVSFDCGEKCINRLMCTECESGSCHCEELCQNRKFQQQIDKAVYPFKAGNKGWGLKSGECIPKGSFVLQYIGEIFSIKSSEGSKRMAQCAQSTCTYLMKLSAKELIDPTIKGSIARFINHSCEPNCITQKWNVLGEVVVGIFSIKEIQAGEELTFDYKFDVYKTPLSVCYCGTPTCRGYLGLRPLNYTSEEWENKMNNLPCEICKGNYENDDDRLLVCDKCNNGFHLECLTPSLNSVPKGAWFCPECSSAATISLEHKSSWDNPMPFKMSESNLAFESHLVTDDIRSRKKQQFFDLKTKVLKEFDEMCLRSGFYTQLATVESLDKINASSEIVLKKYILTTLELSIFKEKGAKLIAGFPNIRIFWVNNEHYYRQYFLKQIEVNINCTATQNEFIDALFNLIEESTKNFKESIGHVEKSFKIPAIFLKRVLGEYYTNLKQVEREFNVKVHFNKKHVTDDCFPIHFLTTIILKSRSENIAKAHAFIKQKISELVARRRYMSRSDIKIIISRLSYIKKEIGPTEIRCCRDNALRDINHPFYTIYYKDKEVAFIGTVEEVMRAERKVAEVIEASRKFEEISTSLNYLIPACEKSMLVSIKNKSEKNFPGNKMILYDPLYPRKNASVTLTSTYREFDEYFEYFKRQLEKKELAGFDFENYQLLTLLQMSKHFFKYIHNFKQTRSLIFMKSWDNLTAEFDGNYRIFNSLMKILETKLFTDPEFLFYVLRVNSLHKKETLLQMNLSVEQLIDILRITLSRKSEGSVNEYSIFNVVKPIKTISEPIYPQNLYNNLVKPDIHDIEYGYKYRTNCLPSYGTQTHNYQDRGTGNGYYDSKRPNYQDRRIEERGEICKHDYERNVPDRKVDNRQQKQDWFRERHSNSSEQSYVPQLLPNKYRKESRFQNRELEISEQQSSESSHKRPQQKYKQDFDFQKSAPVYKDERRIYREENKNYSQVREMDKFDRNREEFRDYNRDEFRTNKPRIVEDEYLSREPRYVRGQEDIKEFHPRELGRYGRECGQIRPYPREPVKNSKERERPNYGKSSSSSEERRSPNFGRRRDDRQHDFGIIQRFQPLEPPVYPPNRSNYGKPQYLEREYQEFEGDEEDERRKRDEFDERKSEFYKRTKY